MADSTSVMSRAAPEGLAPSPRTAVQRSVSARGRLREACYDFEALFLSALMEQMRRPVFGGGLMSPGLAEQAFQEELSFELARGIARAGPFGIADTLYARLNAAPPASETPDLPVSQAGEPGQEVLEDDGVTSRPNAAGGP
jgi:Rod binding domain-containing protein